MKKRLVLIYFVALSGVASLLNYATYPLLARVLSNQDFVNTTVALSLLTQMSSFLSSIVALSAGLAKQDSDDTNEIIEQLQAVLMKFFVLIIVSFLVISPLLLSSINLTTAFIIPVSLLLLFSIPISIISGFLNGKHKIVKLGLATLLSAVLQFTLTILVGYSTKSGALALGAMASGQLIAIFAIYFFYKEDKLPSLSSVIRHKLKDSLSGDFKDLVKFTLLSALGIMAINILQVFDLLIIQHRQLDARLYTDLYIISRVVFFAGTIFIWPFLSYVDIRNRLHNRILFLKLACVFTLISATSTVGLIFFGQQTANVLFGNIYDLETIGSIGVLAITYKYLFLMITSISLFFIVIRSYWSVSLALILTIVTAIFAYSVPNNTSTLSTLYGLNAIAIVGLIIGLVGFYSVTKRN